MKEPGKEYLRKKDYEVRDAVWDSDEKQYVEKMVKREHYSKGLSKVSVFRHVLVRKSDEVIVGAALWLPPTAKAAQSVSKHFFDEKDQHRRVMCLSRLVVLPEVPCNGASFLLSKSERLIKADKRYDIGVTYADERQGHLGKIYEACNWDNLGASKHKTPCYVCIETGRQMSRKRGAKNLTHIEMLEAGFDFKGKFAKIKFVKLF